jgi:DNA-directed RNA polymerase sigma subunit (sigma70/sigma32)
VSGTASPRTLAEEIETLLQELTPGEEHILRLRFGIIGHDAMEIDGVAASLSLPPTAVRWLERSALRKLRQAAMRESRREYAYAG